MELNINKIANHLANNFPAILLAMLISWCVLLQVQVIRQDKRMEELATAIEHIAEGGIITIRLLQDHMNQEEHNGQTEHQQDSRGSIQPIPNGGTL